MLVSSLSAVNYRGSLGFGKDSVDCLLGNIGTQDVNDVQVGEACTQIMQLIHLFPSTAHCCEQIRLRPPTALPLAREHA